MFQEMVRALDHCVVIGGQEDWSSIAKKGGELVEPLASSNGQFMNTDFS